ncbi:uncharacterized protein [Palaemon carinicauda]|uniref:uncharacterized protein n=1 Tax=Palaemon carinicauda TaxID=392227 RepID=UPI0035B69116
MPDPIRNVDVARASSQSNRQQDPPTGLKNGRGAWKLLNEEDLGITSENEKDLEINLVEWQEALERVGSKDRIGLYEKRGSVIKHVEEFEYLGSTIGQEGRCEAEFENWIKASWGVWREVAEVICDKKMNGSQT